MKTERGGSGLAVFVAVVVLAVTGSARAGLILHWDYYEATAELGQAEIVVFQDYREGMSVVAAVEDSDLGSTRAELAISDHVDASDVRTISISSAIDMSVFEDAAGVINFARGDVYFQLVATVSDVPYTFEVEYEFDKPIEDFVTENGHFVCHFGDGWVLYPRAEPYILLWGGMDYTATGFDFAGWGSLQAHAGTDVTLTIAPLPEPATMTLLALGGLAMIRRRRQT